MKITFRNANIDDCNTLFNWVNETQTRNNSFDSREITYEEHVKWFKRVLNSEKTWIFIVEIDKEGVAQLRIDREENMGVIDYSVDINFRGKGVGTDILRTIPRIVKENKIEVEKLIGRVKKENISSVKAFNNAEFVIHQETDNYIEFYKLI